MAAPDPGLIDFLREWVWVPALGLVKWGWNRNQKEHDDMRASLSAMSKSSQELVTDTACDLRQFVVTEDAKLMVEMSTQRGHIGKIFDKMEENSKRSEDRHLQVLEKISELSSAMHNALSHKADK